MMGADGRAAERELLRARANEQADYIGGTDTDGTSIAMSRIWAMLVEATCNLAETIDAKRDDAAEPSPPTWNE